MPGKDNLPVIGISRQQAEEYCRFRSWVITTVFKKNLPAQKFRLLSEEEAGKITSEHGKTCINEVNNGKNISGLYDNADEWLQEGKAIVNGEPVDESFVNIKRTGFRCCLEY